MHEQLYKAAMKGMQNYKGDKPYISIYPPVAFFKLNNWSGILGDFMKAHFSEDYSVDGSCEVKIYINYDTFYIKTQTTYTQKQKWPFVPFI